jgi:imidazolonepropionase
MTLKLFRNARIFTPLDPGSPRGGEAQNLLQVFERGALAVRDGELLAVGEEASVIAALADATVDQEIYCGGRCLIPGFVDPHTHMCFARRREAEFEQRIAGTPYLEILKQGGGILSSVRSVRQAGEDHLYRQTRRRMDAALALGTTTVEIKSGYGLDTESELKMLAAIGRAAATSPMEVVATFLGAHAIPTEYKADPDGFVDLLIEEMLPAVKAQGIATGCDVFCEEAVFSVAQGRRILEAAQALGMQVKLHADEVNDLGGAGLAADLKAVSADHLLAASDANLKKMARAGVVANLLPATAYSLRKPYARARDMMAAGLPVALATDCNPGSSFTESMPFVIGLAVMGMEMTPAEALTAATLNAAYGLGLADRVGSLEAGKQADFLLLDGESPAILAYHAGVSPVVSVYKRGELVSGGTRS